MNLSTLFQGTAKGWRVWRSLWRWLAVVES
ncbi:hypothetical protein V6Z11_A13G067800 [Gossypium hirsutum]